MAMEMASTRDDGALSDEASGVGDEAGVGIEELLEYRVWLGNEQWRVRWRGEGEEADTWETWRVLDTEALRRCAETLRRGQVGGASSTVTSKAK